MAMSYMTDFIYCIKILATIASIQILPFAFYNMQWFIIRKTEGRTDILAPKFLDIFDAKQNVSVKNFIYNLA